MWSRLQLGSIVGAVIGRYFKAGMDKRGIACELEHNLEYMGMPGHPDIILPTYHHVYELKSNYGIKVEPPKQSHIHQVGMYGNALGAEDGHEWTASVVMIQPSLQGSKPRIKEYSIEDFDFASNAVREAERLIRAARASGPPMADVDPKSWQCGFCRFAGCARNKNPNR